MARGNSTPIRKTIGPGTLYAAAIGTAEPETTIASLTEPWPSGWIALGYTEDGSSFSYSVSSEPIEVAEELEPVYTVITGRTASVAFSLAEPTQRNLQMALNGGVSNIVDPETGAAIVFEPPDLGAEVRIMLGHQAESGAERWVWRQCFNTGNLEMARRKGATKTLVPVEFAVEKPETGKKIFARITDASLVGNPVTV